MTTDTRPSARPADLDDELAALLAARRELGRDLEPEVTAAFLARVEASVAARLEDDTGMASNRNRFTQRIAWSLGLGIPLVTLSGIIGGTVGGGDGSTFGAVAAMIATLITIVGLNAYYTEVEKELELTRLRRR
ncbi:MAG: hypothetical protein AB7R89_24625 [Dehalococcoidia bacterium]